MYCTNVNCLPSSLSSASTQPVAIFQDEEESDEEADNEPMEETQDLSRNNSFVCACACKCEYECVFVRLCASVLGSVSICVFFLTCCT